jgi:plastocyanin
MKNLLKLATMFALAALLLSACTADNEPEAENDTTAQTESQNRETTDDTENMMMEDEDTTNDDADMMAEPEDEASPAPEDETAAGDDTDAAPTDVKVVEITASSFSYDVKNIEAAPGQKLRLVVTNDGGDHDLVLDDFAARTRVLGAGESQTLDIEIPASAEAGQTYEYYCSVGDHREMGMTGTITVI